MKKSNFIDLFPRHSIQHYSAHNTKNATVQWRWHLFSAFSSPLWSMHPLQPWLLLSVSVTQALYKGRVTSKPQQRKLSSLFSLHTLRVTVQQQNNIHMCIHIAGAGFWISLYRKRWSHLKDFSQGKWTDVQISLSEQCQCIHNHIIQTVANYISKLWHWLYINDG